MGTIMHHWQECEMVQSLCKIKKSSYKPTPINPESTLLGLEQEK